MPLTWEDVVNKEFQLTKFREGYDREEVEDFLDEVVEELKRLTEENTRLRADLEECRSGTAVPSTQAAPVAEAPAAPAPEAPAAPEVPSSDPVTATSSSAANVLTMAQRLHDEYVAEGEQRRDQIISEAESQAATVVREAEETKTRTLAELQQRKSTLEQDVERLRTFETDYRTRLTSYIEGQLRELTAQPRVEPAQGTV